MTKAKHQIRFQSFHGIFAEHGGTEHFTETKASEGNCLRMKVNVFPVVNVNAMKCRMQFLS